jgi:hypothetical protein
MYREAVEVLPADQGHAVRHAKGITTAPLYASAASRTTVSRERVAREYDGTGSYPDGSSPGIGKGHRSTQSSSGGWVLCDAHRIGEFWADVPSTPLQRWFTYTANISSSFRRSIGLER